jgi:ATP-binding cassette subfamily C protein LapB
VLVADEAGRPLAVGHGGAAWQGRIRRGERLLRLAAEAPPPAARESWLRGLLLGFRPLPPALLGVSFLIALLALGVPQRCRCGSSAFSWRSPSRGAFRALRHGVLAGSGQRIEATVAHAVLDRLLSLPLGMTDRAGLSAQMNRLRDFGTVREFFSGSLALAVLDAPFARLLVGALAVIGGPVALAPLGVLVLFALLLLAMRGPIRRAVSAAAVAAQTRDQLAAEALGAMRLIGSVGAGPVWRARHAAAATEAAAAGARVALLASLTASLSQAIVGAAGLAAVALGVHAVPDGAIAAGGLIASMMIIWRVLGPVQMAFTILSRWEQVRASMRQVDQLMALPPEREPRAALVRTGVLRGDVAFSRLSLRNTRDAEPALLGISAEIRAGQAVALVGPSGAGKTSLLLSILGLHRPSAGSVRIDGFDIRRFDPAELRRAVAYAPTVPQVFYGTVAQNLLLAAPGATEAELRAAAAMTGLDALVATLPRGFDTRIGDNMCGTITASLVTRISLTRLLLRRSRIILMDEPANGLDDSGSAAIASVSRSLRGSATIVFVTHRPSHAALADRVFRLAEGQMEEVRQAPAPTAVRLIPAAAPVAVGDAR